MKTLGVMATTREYMTFFKSSGRALVKARVGSTAVPNRISENTRKKFL